MGFTEIAPLTTADFDVTDVLDAVGPNCVFESVSARMSKTTVGNC